ncbi:MAG: hypothetical protein LBD48_04330, partial [Treponema sp.]|nr:hypothetical protein [Treponema sp.]
MSKTVMRHFNLLLAVLLLASCNGVFGPLDTGAGARPPQGMGYARVSLDYHAPRTLIPSAPSFTRYELLFNCTSSVRPAVTADFGAGLPLGPVALAPGTWDIAVTACQNIIVKGLVTEFAAARGTGTVTISAGLIADPVSITLRPADIPPVPSPGLSGVFSYNITVDNGGGAGGELVLNAKNGELSIPVSLSSFPAAASIEVPAGEYDFSVVLTSSAGMKAGKYAAVHIYAGLETKTDEAADLDFYFTAADFASVIPLAGTLSIREPAGVLTGTKNVTISAYRDKDFSQFLASTGEYQWIDSGTEWFIEIPAPASAVYLRTELKTDDGNGETVYVHREQEPVAGIPVNGKSGIALALALYGIDTGVTVNGTVAAELAGQGRSAVLPGSAVTLKVTPAQRYHLNPSSLTVNGGLIPAVVLPDGDYCFTMPEADVTVNAEFLPDFVSITGKLSLHKPALLDLGAVNNTVISAYRDQGRFERIGLDAVVNWDGGVLDWTVTDIPAGIAIVYLRVEVTGSDNYIYRHDPAAISGIDPVTGKDAGTLTMTVYEISGFSSGGGMVSPDIVYASAGQTAVLAVNPSAGYHLKPGTLAVTRSGGQNV